MAGAQAVYLVSDPEFLVLAINGPPDPNLPPMGSGLQPNLEAGSGLRSVPVNGTRRSARGEACTSPRRVERSSSERNSRTRSDGGTWIECEAISLSRDIPTGLGWLVAPVIRSLPRESLRNTLQATRDQLIAKGQ